MKVPVRQLARHLETRLAHFYLVASDEPLLVAEAADAIRAAARRNAFDERQVWAVDRSFRWDNVAADADALSLFASRRIVELRMQSTRPGDAGSRALRELAEAADADRLILVTMHARLDGAALRSVWMKTIERHGVVVDIWPVERGELPQWIVRRASTISLRLTQGAAEMMAERVEGNLLAADQELRKLALQGIEGEIDEAAVLAAVGDSTRFDVFRLSDAVLAGNASRALRVLDGLRSEGIHPTLIAWALVRELGTIGRLHGARARGDSLDSALGRMHVWRRRQPLLKRAADRIAPDRLRALLRQAAEVDRTIKGAQLGPPWPAITGLVLAAVAPDSRWLHG